MLRLLRAAMGKDREQRPIVGGEVDWMALNILAAAQGVAAIACDGVQRLHSEGLYEGKIDKTLLSMSMKQDAEYDSQMDNLHHLATFFEEHGLRTMVIKGYDMSLNYPVPSHRHCSDLDIYLFGEAKRGDELIAKRFKMKVDDSHHHHNVYVIDGLTIENHFDFLNVYSHKSTAKIEALLKELAEDSHQAGEVWLPSSEFNALFVLRHAAIHFAANYITLRHVLDWGLFVEKHYDEVDWDRHWQRCVEMNMHRFLLAINEICVRYLGFPAEKFRTGGDEALTERVFDDILQSENKEENPDGVVRYIWARWKRWWANRWKHEIVYSDSLLSTFVYQARAHLMKPATLRKV